MMPVKTSQDDLESDVQGRNQIIRLIESAERAENWAQPTGNRRPFESKTKRKQQKAQARDQDGERNPPREKTEFLLIATNKRSGNEKQVDGHVREDHQRNERDLPFPFKEQRAHVSAMGGQPIGDPIKDEEQK